MRTRLLAAFFAPILLGFGQTPPARPEFEFATIKPADPQNPALSGSGFSAAKFTARGTLRDFVRLAYGVQDSQILGGPSWFNSSTFDIDGRPEQPLPPDRGHDQMLAMLQALLADRFQLVVRHETRELSVYALVITKKGPKLLAADGTRGMTTGPGRISGHWRPADLARYFSQTLGRTVLDQTGLTGFFDIKLEWMPEDDSVFTVIQEQLGLRLESTKAPVEVLVIDHAEKPSAN